MTTVTDRVRMSAANLVKNEDWYVLMKYWDAENAQAVAALSQLNPGSPTFMAEFHNWRDGVLGRVRAVTEIEALARAHSKKQKER